MATAAAVAAVHALFLALLMLASTKSLLPAPDAPILVAIPIPEPAPAADPEPEGAEAPPDEAAVPDAMMVPEPDIVIETPDPPPVRPVASEGPDAAAGAADAPGEGTGSAGVGLGTGSGGSGTDSGGGIVRARWLSGRIDRSDYPPRANRAGKGGSVIVHFDVRPDGTIHRCRIRQSSGHPDIDATTCRLIEERFRYAPARDGRGQPVPDVAGWRQDWWLEPRR